MEPRLNPKKQRNFEQPKQLHYKFKPKNEKLNKHIKIFFSNA